MKFCSLSFCVAAVPSFGRWNFIWQAAGAPTSLIGSLSTNLNSMKKAGSNMSSASSFDFTGAYIDALVLNVYAGPGPTKVWIDDLEIGPVQSGPQVAAIPDNNNPAKNIATPRPAGRHSVVAFEANRLIVGKQRMLFRGVRYTGSRAE